VTRTLEVELEGTGEVCLAEEVERLRCLRLSNDEIARRMGVDVEWVRSITAMLAPEASEE
jgi:predicted transposase YdaD